MSDELREAQEAVSEFIIKNVSSNADAQLTARLAISLATIRLIDRPNWAKI
jgi:hypothetical protein